MAVISQMMFSNAFYWIKMYELRLRFHRSLFLRFEFTIIQHENVLISIKISLKFIPKGPINNIQALVQTVDWRRPGDRPLSESMIIILLTHICLTRVKSSWLIGAKRRHLTWPTLLQGIHVACRLSVVIVWDNQCQLLNTCITIPRFICKEMYLKMSAAKCRPFCWATIVLSLMMTSSNGNIFRVTGPLCGEFNGQRWIPRTKASDAKLWCFLWSASWINGWVNNREDCDWRHHRAHYDVIVMLIEYKPLCYVPELGITCRFVSIIL